MLVVREVDLDVNVSDEKSVIVVGIVLVTVGAVVVEEVVVVVIEVVVVKAAVGSVMVAVFTEVAEAVLIEVRVSCTVLVVIDSHLMQNEDAWRKDNAS